MKKVLWAAIALGLVGILTVPAPAQAACRALTCIGGLVQSGGRMGGTACNNSETQTFFHWCGYVEVCNDDGCHIVLSSSATAGCRMGYLRALCITPENAVKDEPWVAKIGGSMYGMTPYEYAWGENSVFRTDNRCPSSHSSEGCHLASETEDD